MAHNPLKSEGTLGTNVLGDVMSAPPRLIRRMLKKARRTDIEADDVANLIALRQKKLTKSELQEVAIRAEIMAYRANKAVESLYAMLQIPIGQRPLQVDEIQELLERVEKDLGRKKAFTDKELEQWTQDLLRIDEAALHTMYRYMHIGQGWIAFLKLAQHLLTNGTATNKSIVRENLLRNLEYARRNLRNVAYAYAVEVFGQAKAKQAFIQLEDERILASID